MILMVLLVLFSFFQYISADELLGKRAEVVLNSVVYRMPSPSIIGKREWKELQLDHLVTILDRTKTSFGRWGLVQLLHPIADKNQLEQRRKIITFLIDHPERMRIFQEQLEQVQRCEKSLLAYWDHHDELSRSCERFYFSALGLEELNKSSIALNASTVLEGFNAVKDLLTAFAMWGVSQELFLWSAGIKPEFNFWQGAKAGLMEPIMRHSPWRYKLGKEPYKAQDVARAVSWGDLFNVWKSGFIYAEPTNTTKNQEQQEANKSIHPESNKDGKTFSGLGAVGGFLTATTLTLFYDYQWVNAIDSIARRIVVMNHSLNRLQERVSDVAHCIKAIMNLRKIIASQDDEFNSYFDMSSNDTIELFIKKLLNKRFLQKPGHLYSRGHVLTIHQDIKCMKRTLISLLHSIALLDAYCSIAQLYKESQNEQVIFSFPEFVESSTPFLQYHDVWLPLLPCNEAITNDLFLGGGQPGKIIITGPNGGGKSTILKTYGIAAVLAQSWGIVPAKSAQQILLASIRTGLATQEDLPKKLSTFMAEKKIMDELLDDIHKSDANHSILVLIDEPYKGTVDDESAKRIYQFGKDVAGFSHALIGIATHVKKPIFLEYDTGGIFANYQVKMRETFFGNFERLFKLEKEPAMWWFEDSDQRSRFIDWISVESTVPN